MVGDVYFQELSYGSYSTFKMVEIDGDNLYVVGNDYEVSSKLRLGDIDVPENYTTEPVELSKSQLKRMYQSEEVYEVERES